MLVRYDHISTRKTGDAEHLNSSLITIEQQPIIVASKENSKFHPNPANFFATSSSNSNFVSLDLQSSAKQKESRVIM